MTCPICLETYNKENDKPTNLRCGHVLCKCCVMNLWDDQQRIKCPTCRREDSYTNIDKDTSIAFALLESFECFENSKKHEASFV